MNFKSNSEYKSQYYAKAVFKKNASNLPANQSAKIFQMKFNKTTKNETCVINWHMQENIPQL